MKPLNVAYLVCVFFSSAAIIIPLPWHLSAMNSGTVSLMLWTFIGCIIHLVNTILWDQSLRNDVPVWCDISTKLIVGINIAIPLSSLCINRRLYMLASIQNAVITKKEKRRNVIVDTILTVLCPMIYMAVHYTIQGHRYDVLEDFGCWPSMYNTLPMYILIYGPLITVCAISFVYCVLSIRAFLRRRSDFNEFLRSASIGMSSTRYIRLMAIAGVEVLIGLPTSLYVLISTLKSIGVARYISWEDTHSHFSRVRFYPLILLKAQHNGLVGTLEFSRWSFVFISFIFFALFGFVDEAKRNYKRAFNTLVRPFGIKPLTSGSTQYGSKPAPSMSSKLPPMKGLSLGASTIAELDLPPSYLISPPLLSSSVAAGYTGAYDRDVDLESGSREEIKVETVSSGHDLSDKHSDTEHR